MTTEDLHDLDALASLTDHVRRRAYRVVAGGSGPVGRDEVAEVLGVGRTLAAFHLDKLVAAGLLEVSYARRSGKTGPGAGRPAKLYQVAAAEHAVSVPPRAYRSAAEVLAEAIEQAGVEQTVYQVARRHGRQATLADYSPAEDGPDRMVLRNCPFHQLAEQFPGLICGMNLAMLTGLLEDDVEWTPRMDPGPGRCCVTLSKKQID